MSIAIRAAERALLPDRSIRWGIRRLLRKRLQELAQRAMACKSVVDPAWLDQMRTSPIALDTNAANDQHYEVPASFYELCLGRHRKYSSAWWDAETRDLDQAEARMLALTCERACLANGQRILELGCGWGSLSLWMAERYPAASILSVSNSRSQGRFIRKQAEARGLGNLEVVTADMNDFAPDGRFDRVVSVEMIEHIRNWESLLTRVASWLEPTGCLFLHFFSHRVFSYPFEDRGSSDWMARHFFTGGLMPSHDLLTRLDIPLQVEADWCESGTHYARTAEAWLRNLDRYRPLLLEILEQKTGLAPRDAERQLQRWRIFFLSCAELFGYEEGSEWTVSHYRLRPIAVGEAS